MRTSKTIKDPTFNIYRRGGSVEKAMESKGDGKAKKELMQLAKDEKDILFDVESEITDILFSSFVKSPMSKSIVLSSLLASDVAIKFIGNNFIR